MEKELARYIIRYFPHLMTSTESKALRHLRSVEKLDLSNQHSVDERKDGRIKVYKSAGWLSEDSNVLSLLDEGNDEFTSRTAEKILQENTDSVLINNCPKCGRLARTPEARQCRHCGASWR